MDKLKPIIENKFWILLFLAMLLPTIGWFVASGTFAEEIEKRESELEKAFNDLNFPPDVPNKEWEENVQTLVEEEQARLDRTSRALWNTQKQVMDWPAGVQEFMVDVPYEGTIPATARENYRRIGQGYEKQLDEIEDILEPYDPLTRTGKVLIERAAYTHVPIGTWKSGPPTSQAMWNAQIDAWLVRSIFEAISSMNKGNDKLSDSIIVQVLDLKLRGGIRDYSASQGTSVAGGASGNPSGEAENAAMYLGTTGGGYGSGGNDGARGNLKVNVQFDLSDELGPDSGAGGGTPGAGAYGMMSEGAAESAPSTSSLPQGPRRYVDDDENLPFRTRGFVLGVVMHHRYLNEFLAELSGSKWPIQVIRVHQQINNPDSLALVGRTGSSPRRGSSRGYGSGAGLASGFGTPGGGGFGSSLGEYGPGADPENAGFGGGGTTRPGSSGRGMSGGGGANDLMIQQALSDPHLATVWIGGLITLFKPVDEPEATQTAPAESEEEPLPETSEQADPTAADAVPESPTTPESETETPADSTTNDPNATTSEGADPDAPQPATDNTPSAPGDSEPETPPATRESIS